MYCQYTSYYTILGEPLNLFTTYRLLENHGETITVVSAFACVNFIETNPTTISLLSVPHLDTEVYFAFSLPWSRVCPYGRQHVTALQTLCLLRCSTNERKKKSDLQSSLKAKYQFEFSIKCNYCQRHVRIGPRTNFDYHFPYQIARET